MNDANDKVLSLNVRLKSDESSSLRTNKSQVNSSAGWW